MNERNSHRAHRDSGQAMVEFVLMLFLFMILISGMLYFFRLLLFDFWAQQEARILAFEQVWAPSASYNDALVDPVNNIESGGTALRRPGLVTNLSKTRSITREGSLTNLLLSRLFPSHEGWTSDRGGLVETAYASVDSGDLRNLEPIKTSPRPRARTLYVPEIERGAVGLLEQIGFGPRFCEVGIGVLTKYHYRINTTPFADPNCGEYYNQQFGVHLAQTTDLAQGFRDYGERLEEGMPPRQALEQTVRSIVAQGFYSFFDSSVKTAFQGVVPYIVAERLEETTGNADASITRMISDLRYLGSSAALLLIGEKFVEVVTRDPSSRDVAGEKTFEDSVNDLLHADASAVLPIVGDGFFLSPAYLPIPPTFGPGVGGLFDGGMATALSDEDSKVESLVDQSNRKTEVHYNSEGGLFPAATRRFATAGRIMDARFYLITQDWHIWRQREDNFTYLDKGDQFDDIHDETEEGHLRQRVLGYWLFPSLERADLLFKPITGLLGFDALDGVLSVVNGIGSFIGTIKSFLVNNPFLDILDGLSQIPLIGSIIPTFPKWPAVRPDAYPHTEEIKDDKLAGPDMPREFKDYVEEQKKFNPPPKPTFH